MNLIDRVLLWIGNKTNTFILIPWPLTIGNAAESILFGIKRARIEKKKLVLLFPPRFPWKLKHPLHSRVLREVQSETRLFGESRIFDITTRFVLFLLVIVSIPVPLWRRIRGVPLHMDMFYPNSGHNILWQPSPAIKEFSQELFDSYNPSWSSAEPLNVTLSARLMKRCDVKFKEFPLSESDWFVCLHVRESGFHGDTSNRSASISNYFQGIQEITSRGGWVIRMGDSSMTPLPPMERVIDYPFTKWKSSDMDLYLIKKCRAFLGMQSGILDVALLFEKPLILVNLDSIFHQVLYKHCDIGISKHVYSKKESRWLCIKEQLEEPIIWVRPYWDSDEYLVKENSEQEIREVIEEWFLSEEKLQRTTMQESFDTRLKDEFFKQIKKSATSVLTSDDVHNQYRMAAHLRLGRGNFGNRFLTKHFE
jgi:putative glycosyltransferase (TIGR04372 family)